MCFGSEGIIRPYNDFVGWAGEPSMVGSAGSSGCKVVLLLFDPPVHKTAAASGAT